MYICVFVCVWKSLLTLRVRELIMSLNSCCLVFCCVAHTWNSFINFIYNPGILFIFFYLLYLQPRSVFIFFSTLLLFAVCSFADCVVDTVTWDFSLFMGFCAGGVTSVFFFPGPGRLVVNLCQRSFRTHVFCVLQVKGGPAQETPEMCVPCGTNT